MGGSGEGDPIVPSVPSPVDVEIGNSAADVVWQYMIEAGLAVQPTVGGNWPLYCGRLPDDDTTADDLIAIFNTAGVLHGKDMVSGAQYLHHGIQLRFRSVDDRDGLSRAQTILDYLLAMHHETITTVEGNTYLIHSFTQTSDITPILEDDKNRTHHTVNLIVAYTKTS